MKFDQPLVRATLLRRYKRFLADVIMDDGREITVYCPNTGAMLGCCAKGSVCWLSAAANPARKYAWTWELVVDDSREAALVGIHTGRSNGLVLEALGLGLVPKFAGAKLLRTEPPNPMGRGRFDLQIEDKDGIEWLVEVKNVTAAVRAGRALFPDAVTTRGTRHMRELEHLHRSGTRTALCFCVQRADVTSVVPADEIDPDYGAAVRDAAAAGVPVLAVGCDVSPTAIVPNRSVDVML